MSIQKTYPAQSGIYDESVTVIEPKSGWQMLNLKELIGYRDLLYYLTMKDIKVLYAQTILGLAWAILQPLIQIVLFTIVFGKIAKVGTDGIPYLLFSTVAIIPWTYISQAMAKSAESLVNNQQILGKIYLPRLVFPISPILGKLVDFAISILVLLIILIYYRIHPTWNLLLFPLFLLLMMLLSTGAGMWLSALAIRFRDVRYATEFAIRMLMYSAPIVYSASSVPDKFKFLYSLNPIVAVIEGFRTCLLGTPVPWTFILPGTATTIILLVTGIFYFKRMERVFVDVI